MSKLRNTILFVSIAAVLALGYIFFVRSGAPAPGSLVTSSAAPLPDLGGAAPSSAADTAIAKDFLALLLNVKNIKLEDAIFADPSFQNLHDSSIALTPDGTEGRPNPFAKLGSDAAAPAVPQSSASVPDATPLPQMPGVTPMPGI